MISNYIIVYFSGGGTGFIGHHLRRMLEHKGYEVLSVSRKAGQDKITWVIVKLHNDIYPYN